MRYVGVSPPDVVKCVTKIGPAIVGRANEFGTVAPGKLADLLVMDGDVVAEISVLEDRSRFIAVMQDGVVKAGRLTRPVPESTRS